MTVSVIVATYGEDEWKVMASERAEPSVWREQPDEVVMFHGGTTIAESRNEAATLATSTHLVFLDADDQFAPGYLGAMRRALEQVSDGDVLLTPAAQVIRKGRPGPPAFFERRGITLREDNWLVVGTLISRDLFNRVGGFCDYPHGFEDWSLWSKCYRLGARVLKVPEAVYLYHHNPQSKHKQGWRDRKWQVETHQRVARELDAWEAAL